MARPTLTPGWRRALRAVLLVAVLTTVGLLLGRALVDNWAEVQAQSVRFTWPMVAAVLVFAVAVPVSGLLWGQIVNRLSNGPRAGRREAMAVHSASWLLKYIPGQAGSLLNKLVWGKDKGFSRTLIVITFIYENIFLQLASIVPSVIVLLVVFGSAIFESNAATLVLPLIALIPLIALLDRRIFHRLMAILSKRMLKQELPEEYFLPTRYTALYLAEFLIPRAINGVGFVFVAASFMEVPATSWLPLAATYVLAGALGILAVFVPSGLGVREAVVFIFALQFVTPAQAVLLSLLSRLLSTAADLVVALIYAGLRFSIRRGERPGQGGTRTTRG